MTFKRVVKEASAMVADALGCVELRTGRLYTPFWKKGKAYGWMSPMDTDGMLVSERGVEGGPAKAPKGVTVAPLLVGVLIQSEEATGRTKPNPYGKAAVVNAPLGLWVDRVCLVSARNGSSTKTTTVRSRVRLDHVWVLFVAPDDIPGLLSNLEVVTTAHRDSWYLPFPRATTPAAMAARITTDVRGFLVGKGRPKAP